MDYYLEVVDIRDYVGRSKKRLGIIRGRLIGREGKTRRIIEEMTGCDLAIQGHTVSIISDLVHNLIIHLYYRHTSKYIKGSWCNIS